MASRRPVASFTKEVNPRLTKCPLEISECLANRGLTSLVNEATATSHYLNQWWLITDAYVRHLASMGKLLKRMFKFSFASLYIDCI